MSRNPRLRLPAIFSATTPLPRDRWPTMPNVDSEPQSMPSTNFENWVDASADGQFLQGQTF